MGLVLHVNDSYKFFQCSSEGLEYFRPTDKKIWHFLECMSKIIFFQNKQFKKLDFCQILVFLLNILSYLTMFDRTFEFFPTMQ